MQQSVIILGMHRSGASAMAGALRVLGVEFGPSPTPADEGGSPEGAGEHPEIVQRHDHLLTALRRGWDDPRGLPKQWRTGESAQAARQELAGLVEGTRQEQLRAQRALHVARLKEHEATRQVIAGVVADMPKLAQPAVFWELLRDLGERNERMYLDWLDEAMATVEAMQ